MKNETMLKALLVDDEPFITKGLSIKKTFLKSYMEWKLI